MTPFTSHLPITFPPPLSPSLPKSIPSPTPDRSSSFYMPTSTILSTLFITLSFAFFALPCLASPSHPLRPLYRSHYNICKTSIFPSHCIFFFPPPTAYFYFLVLSFSLYI